MNSEDTRGFYLLINLRRCELLQSPLDLRGARLSERRVLVLLLRLEAAGRPLHTTTTSTTTTKS